LLSHQIPRGDIALVLEKVLELAIAQLEKQRYATTRKPRKAYQRASRPRTIPAHVRRAVRERDGEQCTFVSSDGRRCTERSFLEFDHALEVARGGKATVEGIRLRCRAHNQYTAERTFGTEFMKRKRRARTG
jgi:5-methylcytosine-specific restriction endonuclease McrA